MGSIRELRKIPYLLLGFLLSSKVYSLIKGVSGTSSVQNVVLDRLRGGTPCMPEVAPLLQLQSGNRRAIFPPLKIKMDA